MEGYSAPIHQALTQPILLGGAPREFAILNGTLCAALTLGAHSLLGIPVGLAIQALAAYFAKSDPEFFHTVKRHIHFKVHYEA